MKLREITNSLEKLAPLALQESYDNSGLLAGDPEMEITAALLSLDCTEEVVEEAASLGCNLVIAHHPIVFTGLKRLTGRTYVERTLIRAIRSNVALYAIHTNLDNIRSGVNDKIADKLGLVDRRILLPRQDTLQKLVVFVPESHTEILREALFGSGAGHIGQYDKCSFHVSGTGTFRGGPDTQPFIGKPGHFQAEPEVRVEVILPAWLSADAIAAARAVHPYEEMAYDLYPMLNRWEDCGSGLVGSLPEPLETIDFLKMVKEKMQAGSVRYTALCRNPIRKVAICGGSGAFLLPHAIAAQADIFVTSDFKYHQYFDAEGRIVIADIGHFESEQYTPEVLADWLGRNFPTFATHFSRAHTNPISYL